MHWSDDHHPKHNEEAIKVNTASKEILVWVSLGVLALLADCWAVAYTTARPRPHLMLGELAALIVVLGLIGLIGFYNAIMVPIQLMAQTNVTSAGTTSQPEVGETSED